MLAQDKRHAGSTRSVVAASSDDTNRLDSDLEFSSSRVKSYADLITIHELASMVIDDLGFEMTASSCGAEVPRLANSLNSGITTEAVEHVARCVG